MTKHEISLNCTDFKEANFDIVVEGVGWISVQGRGFATFNLLLPEGVNFHIRDDPMQPFEANHKGLKRYQGNTVNARTKRNLSYNKR